jgi:hypothetical protein
MPAKYVRACSKGQKNDFRDAEAIAGAVQRPTMKFVATKTADQLRLAGAAPGARTTGQAAHQHHQSDSRLPVGTRGISVRQGFRFLRRELPSILAKRSDALSPRMMRAIEDLANDWRRLDERIDGLSADITSLVERDPACERLMTVPGIGPIISSATVAAIGNGDVFSEGRDFAAWLGLVPRQISTGDHTILGKISKRGNRWRSRLTDRPTAAPQARRAPNSAAGSASPRPPARTGRAGTPAAVQWLIRIPPDNREGIRMKLQIVLAAVGGIGVVDLPEVVVVVQSDLAPACEALVAQHGLDAGPLFGTGGPVCEHLSGG